jgi:hypothetical protein
MVILVSGPGGYLVAVMDRLLTILTKMLSDKNYDHGSGKALGTFFGARYSLLSRRFIKKAEFISTVWAVMARGMLRLLSRIIKTTSDEIRLIIEEKDCALVFSRKNN